MNNDLCGWTGKDGDSPACTNKEEFEIVPSDGDGYSSVCREHLVEHFAVQMEASWEYTSEANRSGPGWPVVLVRVAEGAYHEDRESFFYQPSIKARA